VDVVPLPSDVGLHAMPVSAGNGTVTDPAAPVTEIGPPAAVVPDRLVSPKVELSAVLDMVTLIVATTPSCISESFNPDSMHVYEPVLGKQVMFLLAAEALDPATAPMEAMLVGG
jgi:hypothetical protein